jgi:hypothetical protein
VTANPPPTAISVTRKTNQKRPTTKLVIMKSSASHGSPVTINRNGLVGRLGRDGVVALVGVVADIDTFLIPSREPGHVRR